MSESKKRLKIHHKSTPPETRLWFHIENVFRFAPGKIILQKIRFSENWSTFVCAIPFFVEHKSTF